MTTKSKNPAQSIPQIIGLLDSFNDEEQSRIIQSVVSFLGLKISPKGRTDGRTGGHLASDASVGNGRDFSFSGHEELSPKDFLSDKKPQTDVERVTCLAYYLTHYRGSNQFKTADISNLNTEAAQRKFTNAADAIRKASTQGYLVPAPQKRHKQISAVGEQYVTALPDRELAKEVMKNSRPRHARNKKKTVARKV